MTYTFAPTKLNNPHFSELLSDSYLLFENTPGSHTLVYQGKSPEMPAVSLRRDTQGSLESVRIVGHRGKGVGKVLRALYRDEFENLAFRRAC